MANYLTESYLLTVFPEQDLIDLTDSEGVGEINQAVLASAIAAAEGEFHGYVGRRYQTPLSIDDDAEMAETVRGVLVSLLTYKLWQPPRKPQVPQSVRDAYRDAVDWLKGVAKGEISLGAASGPAASSGAPNQVDSDGEEPRMTHDSLTGF